MKTSKKSGPDTRATLKDNINSHEQSLELDIQTIKGDVVCFSGFIALSGIGAAEVLEGHLANAVLVGGIGVGYAFLFGTEMKDDFQRLLNSRVRLTTAQNKLQNFTDAE